MIWLWTAVILILSACVLLLLMGLTYRFVKQIEIKKRAKKLVDNGGISEVVKLKVRGEDQYLLIEGEEANQPIMLFLHGGPGQPFPFGVSSRGQFPQLNRKFTTVFYDQRGAGKSYHKHISKESMTVERFIDDTEQVIDYLRDRFKVDKIYLVGMSWGTIIGMKLAHKSPNKFHAYVGFDQVTNMTDNQRLGMKALRARAEESGDQKMLAQLIELGEPPFFEKKEGKYSDFIQGVKGYIYKDDQIKGPNVLALIKSALLSPDYNLKDIFNSLVSAPKFNIFECTALQEALIRTDLTTITRLDIPFTIVQGRHDLTTNFHAAKLFYEKIDAPSGKHFYILEQSAHIPNEHDFKKFIGLLQNEKIG
ncbi:MULTISPECIES: alpha/beta fold hydrolase [unclassified Bacillus (in: firmicutes)]|uniref:alpha/beta fold hydrolase n=1 Tax=unclassified Bacillus (in: firmicutes) TaxID=185979 RepID=UPI0008ED1897|nr:MULTISPECIES: alpha/beta hydrolase [unclassified Bacillus (in: firmicutes)]SFB07932.1 Pimeloyl-ACP methyl ester carboxylesterase [Bacillus sp. UNCCL13]SFQ87176.1 Pimeloyl-ACP methyl ester carboxylesterase [Bacillus sp. cl95]